MKGYEEYIYYTNSATKKKELRKEKAKACLVISSHKALDGWQSYLAFQCNS